MTGKVFFSVTMSLDGFIPADDLASVDYSGSSRSGLQNLKLGEGGEEGRENDIVRETFERTGASVMGKRMFGLGEQAWAGRGAVPHAGLRRDAREA